MTERDNTIYDDAAEYLAEREDLIRRLKVAEDRLDEVRDFAEARSDVVDGPYGEPVPNDWMRLYLMISDQLP